MPFDTNFKRGRVRTRHCQLLLLCTDFHPSDLLGGHISSGAGGLAASINAMLVQKVEAADRHLGTTELELGQWDGTSSW